MVVIYLVHFILFGVIMSDIRGTIRDMLQKGQDPKDYLIEICRPQCSALQQKLQRCETALKNMSNADPELSCMYPLRDWVTCIDACVQLSRHRYSPKSTLNWPAMNLASSRDIYTQSTQSLNSIIHHPSYISPHITNKPNKAPISPYKCLYVINSSFILFNIIVGVK